MQLPDWLKKENLTPEAFGERLGVKGMTIRRYCSGGRMPKPEICRQIVDATGGEVTVQDLHDCYLLGVEA